MLDTGSGKLERRLPGEAVVVLDVYRRTRRPLQKCLSRAVVTEMIYHTAVITVATGVSGISSFGLHGFATSGRRKIL